MTDTTELKTCPFCRKDNTDLYTSDDKKLYIGCVTEDCFTGGPIAETREEAESKWNAWVLNPWRIGSNPPEDHQEVIALYINSLAVGNCQDFLTYWWTEESREKVWTDDNGNIAQTPDFWMHKIPAPALKE